MMAYQSPPCPWDEANLPFSRWDLSALQKLCPQSWKFWPFTPHPLLYLVPLWVPPARILFPFTQGRIHIISSCLNLLPVMDIGYFSYFLSLYLPDKETQHDTYLNPCSEFTLNFLDSIYSQMTPFRE